MATYRKAKAISLPGLGQTRTVGQALDNLFEMAMNLYNKKIVLDIEQKALIAQNMQGIQATVIASIANSDKFSSANDVQKSIDILTGMQEQMEPTNPLQEVLIPTLDKLAQEKNIWIKKDTVYDNLAATHNALTNLFSTEDRADLTTSEITNATSILKELSETEIQTLSYFERGIQLDIKNSIQESIDKFRAFTLLLQGDDPETKDFVEFQADPKLKEIKGLDPNEVDARYNNALNLFDLGYHKESEKASRELLNRSLDVIQGQAKEEEKARLAAIKAEKEEKDIQLQLTQDIEIAKKEEYKEFQVDITDVSRDALTKVGTWFTEGNADKLKKVEENLSNLSKNLGVSLALPETEKQLTPLNIEDRLNNLSDFFRIAAKNEYGESEGEKGFDNVWSFIDKEIIPDIKSKTGLMTIDTKLGDDEDKRNHSYSALLAYSLKHSGVSLGEFGTGMGDKQAGSNFMIDHIDLNMTLYKQLYGTDAYKGIKTLYNRLSKMDNLDMNKIGIAGSAKRMTWLRTQLENIEGQSTRSIDTSKSEKIFNPDPE